MVREEDRRLEEVKERGQEHQARVTKWQHTQRGLVQWGAFLGDFQKDLGGTPVKMWLSCCQGDRGSDYHHSARKGKGGRVTVPKGKGLQASRYTAFLCSFPVQWVR